MNGVLGMVNLLRRSALNESSGTTSTTSSPLGEHLLAIIDDILDFSKIEAGKIQLASDDFSLGELVHDAWSLMGERFHAKGLESKPIATASD